MNNLKNKLSYTLAIVVTVLFISCSAEDGAIGPAGADGKDGINGIDGVNGTDGNANVKTVLIEKVNLIKDQYKDFTVNSITQDILDNGVVLVYAQVSAIPSVWYPLPYEEKTSRITVFKIELNEIRLISNFDTVVLDLKIVTIAGNSTTASKNTKSNILSSLESNGIDVNDYNQVAAYYNLKD